MAKQDSIVTFRGKLDGITFFRHPFYGSSARISKGPDKKEILNNPNYSVLKNNINTMEIVSPTCKFIRAGFKEIENIAYGKMNQWLVSEGWRIYKARDGVRHPFEGEAIKSLKGFCFTKSSINQVLSDHYSTHVDGSYFRVALKSKVNAAPNSTHFTYALNVCSFDFVRQEVTKNHCYSNDIPADQVEDVVLTAEMDLTKPIQMCVLSVICSQNVNGLMYQLKHSDHTASEIVQVFVNE